MELIRCIYDHSEQKAFARQFVDQCVKAWADDEKVRNKNAARGVKNWAHQFHFSILCTFVAAAMKDPAFAEECEWRLVGVCRDHASMKFRNSRSFVSPYIEINWTDKSEAQKQWEQPIESIIIGPNPNPKLAAKSVRKLLDASASGDVRVLESKMPFRAW